MDMKNKEIFLALYHSGILPWLASIHNFGLAIEFVMHIRFEGIDESTHCPICPFEKTCSMIAHLNIRRPELEEK